MKTIESICVFLAPFVNAQNAQTAQLVGILGILSGVLLLMVVLILLRKQRPTKPETQGESPLKYYKGPRSGFVGFTLIELLTVLAIISILISLILAASGGVMESGARNRAKGEIAAISAALESYRADNGIYPSSLDTDNAKVSDKPNKTASATLAVQVCGASVVDLKKGDSPVESMKVYMDFSGSRRTFSGNDYYDNGTRKQKGELVSVTLFDFDTGEAYTQNIPFLVDPWGNPYGYSTRGDKNPAGVSFDLWSRGRDINEVDQKRWITNW